MGLPHPQVGPAQLPIREDSLAFDSFTPRNRQPHLDELQSLAETGGIFGFFKPEL
jgi:hypothetical protein